jgi:hypothetical protein
MHHYSVSGPTGARISTYNYDMRDYMRSAVELYIEKTGLQPRPPVSTPYVPDIPPAELDILVTTRGKFAEHALCLLMKLLYGVRMAFPPLAVAIHRLATQITKWTADCDRRLHRLFCWLEGHCNLSLKGSLSESDIDTCTIRQWPDADLHGDFSMS